MHVMVADVIKFFDTVGRSILDYLTGSVRYIFLFIVRFVSGLSLLLGLGSRGAGMVVFTRAVL